MTVQEFFKIVDAIRFDDSLDEQYPELRGMARAWYPRMRTLYNIISDIYGGDEELNESHGNKKHNYPKDAIAAMKHGEWEKRKDYVGDGFKSNTSAYKNNRDKRQEKVSIRNYEKYIDEAVNEALNNYKNTLDN